MRPIAIVLSFVMVLPAGAQIQALSSPKLTQPDAPWVGTKSYMSKIFGDADTRVTLDGPVRLRDYVVGGKLELSLKAYLDLVLANNTDIALQRITLETPKNAEVRAYGTFDPTLTTSFQATRSQTPATNQLQGAAVPSTLNQPFSARYQQNMVTGGNIFSQFSSTKLSTNDSFALFNPSYTQNLQFGFTQPLLRNRGAFVTKLPISIAKTNQKIAGYNFEDYLIRYVVTAENAYWDVVAQRENIKVLEQALELANESLKRARDEIRLGATSELEIFQPEQQAATARINLTNAQFQLLQTEDVLRRYMGADLDPEVRKLPIVLTEKVEPTVDEKPFDREALVADALASRPDLKVQRANIEVADLNIASSLNAMKPLLNLTGSYQTYGRGGNSLNRTTGVMVPGGITDAFGMLFGFNYPTYVGGLTLTLPLRDRRSAADLADQMINKKSTVLRVRQAEQQARQDILNAITQVERSRASVQLAKIALDYAVKRAEADKKRYELGTITLFFLLSAQTDLTNAQSALVNQTVQYRRNLLNLQQRLGTILSEKGIVVQ